ncbi:MAG: GNAT family N-acetyltransferase [Prevotellaceae bacterium]|jgi:GNAT superfamily N-acetyltransferase|nr:GNAT family N-acetyltransferase [Prevotellaceae bacterium]
MEIIRIKNEKNTFFNAFWKIYESSFPLCERRSPDDQNRIFANETYSLEIWTENETVTGFIGWWNCGDLRFIEHYAIHPDYRSRGYGSRLLSEWIKQSSLPVLLEIEPPADELSRKRQQFYYKLGFRDNDVKHSQPPYHKNEKPLKLWLMSYPREISANCYQKFYRKQLTEIMPQF